MQNVPPNLLTWDQAQKKSKEGDLIVPVTFQGKVYYEVIPGGSQAGTVTSKKKDSGGIKRG